MNKETLRMQMLAGIITESQYKAKLDENEGWIDIEYSSGDYVGEINNGKVTFHYPLMDNEEEIDITSLSDFLNYIGPNHFFTELITKTEDENGNVTAEFDIAGDEVSITVGLNDLKSNFGEYII